MNNTITLTDELLTKFGNVLAAAGDRDDISIEDLNICWQVYDAARAAEIALARQETGGIRKISGYNPLDSNA